MTATTVTLGGVTFKDMEVPERIPFGGEQALAVHRMIGGRKVIDTMGPDDAPLSWSGRFFGADALDRALAVDAIRKRGQAVELRWSRLAYRVVVRRFMADFEKVNNLTYQIECEVQEDLAFPVTAAAQTGVDQMIPSDMASATALGNQIGDATLTGKLSTLGSAVSAVSKFATATKAQIASVLTPLADAQATVTTLIASVTNTMTNIATLGGVAPYTPLARAAAGLAQQAAAVTQAPRLYDLQSVLGRMGTNLSAIGASGANVVLAGGDLYHAAAKAYGDPSGWTTIAKANGLTDPQIEGVQNVRVPPTMEKSGGVLAP